MLRTKALDLNGPAGRLEAILMTPKGHPVAAGVVCHAHPQHGGTMHLKVVFRAARGLQRAGVAALRFNFRGVGRSLGVHDDGRGEQDDVRAALDLLERQFPGLPLVLGGFSFGSTMALLVGWRERRVRALFALGFPATFPPNTSFLESQPKPLLFVQCENDPFGPAEKLRSLVRRLSGPSDLVILPGADHMFTNLLDEAEQALSSWIARHPWERCR